MQRLASVIIVNYNYCNFLEACIESVLQQTYKNIELIIVDDGSTDNSRSVIEGFRDTYSNIDCIYKENSGQAAALCTGVLASRGDVVFFLDSDDVFREDKVEIVMGIFENNNVSGVVHPALVLEEFPTNKVWPPGDLPESAFLVSTKNSVDDYGLYYFVSSCLSFKRKAALKIARYKGKGWPYKHYGDVYFDRPLYLTEDIICIPETLTNYRVHKNSHHLININAKSEENPEGKIEFIENQYEHVNFYLDDYGLKRINKFKNIKYIELLYCNSKIGLFKFLWNLLVSKNSFKLKVYIFNKNIKIK